MAHAEWLMQDGVMEDGVMEDGVIQDCVTEDCVMEDALMEGGLMQGLNEQDGFEVLKKPCGKPEQSRLFTLGLAIDLVQARVRRAMPRSLPRSSRPLSGRSWDRAGFPRP